MAALTRAMPIYEALLALAKDDERAAILAGGPRWMLNRNRASGGDPDRKNAIRAYAAIKQVLVRVADTGEFRVTGIDREMSSSREAIELEDAVAGTLVWELPDGRRSMLCVDVRFPGVEFADVRVEPLSTDVPASIPHLPPPSAPRTERIDDTVPLAAMAKYVGLGALRKTAARRVVQEMPGARTLEQEDSIVRRLQRKYDRQ